MTTNETIMNQTIKQMNAHYEAATMYRNPSCFYNLKPKAQVVESKKAVKNHSWLMHGAAQLGFTLLSSTDEAFAKRITREECILSRKFEELLNSIKVEEV